MRQQTRELALASVLGALAVLFLFLGGVLPLALYACPLLASVCLLPVREECRASYQWCCFFAAAILGLLLGPDKESALLFCFLGYYPLLQPSLDAIGSRALRFLTKLGLYVLAVGAMYALLVFVFRLDAVTAELAATAPWLIAATFALGAVLLFLYDELLRRADVVTLHCLLTDETRKLIDRERLALMKPTALLINCARGPIVDEAALIEALENGRLAGAGLDVTDPEPVAPDSPLFKLPNVIVTPHYAPTTVESATRVSKIAAENINAVLAGQEPVGRIV